LNIIYPHLIHRLNFTGKTKRDKIALINQKSRAVLFIFGFALALNVFKVIFIPFACSSGAGNNQSQGGWQMKHSFYDVKAKKKVQADVTKKVTYGKKGNERYAFQAKTADGRSLTAFVSKADWTAAKI